MNNYLTYQAGNHAATVIRAVIASTRIVLIQDGEADPSRI